VLGGWSGSCEEVCSESFHSTVPEMESLMRVMFVLTLLAFGFAPEGVAQADSGSTGGDYLRPGDVVRVQIWMEPGLSGDFMVSEAGVVVLPRLGPLEVTDLSADALRRRLVESYRDFLQHTSIEVALLRRLQVLGAVRNPGLYPADGTLSLADVVALAGGTTPQGHPQRVELIRDGQRIDAHLSRGTRISDSRIRSGDQIYVPERSWVSRNTGVVAAALTATASLVATLLLR
jgi:polysaccharide biosynthesis/export protein